MNNSHFPTPSRNNQTLPKSANQRQNFPTYTPVNMSTLLKMETAKNMESDRELKQKMALWVQEVIVCYLVGIFIIVIFYMFLKICNIQLLSDAVLITILTTTTLNLLGMPLIVLKSLFKENTNSNKGE